MTHLMFALLIALSAPALAQHHAGPPSPYAGLEQRPVKALSEQQIADLRAGRGMSLALPAELNGYPGPLHVLELAERLSLTDGQRARVRELFDSMKREAVSLGEELISREAELDRQFAARTITPASLTVHTDAIGETQAALRRTHLKYHLATVEVLTPEQVRRYGELRGYGRPDAAGGHGHGRSHPH
jgi:Spy/CpxP family protein refolding chaperone